VDQLPSLQESSRPRSRSRRPRRCPGGDAHQDAVPRVRDSRGVKARVDLDHCRGRAAALKLFLKEGERLLEPRRAFPSRTRRSLLLVGRTAPTAHQSSACSYAPRSRADLGVECLLCRVPSRLGGAPTVALRSRSNRGVVELAIRTTRWTRTPLERGARVDSGRRQSELEPPASGGRCAATGGDQWRVRTILPCRPGCGDERVRRPRRRGRRSPRAGNRRLCEPVHRPRPGCGIA